MALQISSFVRSFLDRYGDRRDLHSFPTRRSSDLREISMKDVFRSGDSSKKFKIAEGQWYRYAPSYVSPERKTDRKSGSAGMPETDLVCRLLLEKKKSIRFIGCSSSSISRARNETW